MDVKELPIPPEAETDPNAIELVRVWAAHRGLTPATRSHFICPETTLRIAIDNL
jgi:hypothetical protein